MPADIIRNGDVGDSQGIDCERKSVTVTITASGTLSLSTSSSLGSLLHLPGAPAVQPMRHLDVQNFFD